MVQDLDDEDPGIVEVESQCQHCAHLHKETRTTCEAFPMGIPFVILLGEYDHTQPYMVDGVVLDRGLRYEPEDS
jgi:hypothetical protein